MSTKEVAQKLVALCREGKNLDAIDQLYASDIVSVEAVEGGGMPREMRGMEAVRGKSQWWLDNHEVHDCELQGPFYHGDDQFAVYMKADVTYKPDNKRMQIDEIGVYTVKDGKVAHEAFYYDMPQ